MSKLCISLPPFAPDYSGAASALFDMGGMIVIHDASGCTGNYTGYDEPRWYDSQTAVYCSGLRHMDAVLGNDEKLINKIAEAAQGGDKRFIAVLGSPVPMVIGTDFNGIAKEIENITGIPAIGLATRGLEYYPKGIADAITALMNKMVHKKQKSIPRTINLLGVTPLDFYINGNHTDFVNLFNDNEIKVLASYSMGMSIEDMQNSVAAQLNVAVSQAGVLIGEYMREKYNIPYIAITPVGDGTLTIDAVEKALQNDMDIENPENAETDILIIGEQIIGNSIREYLQKKYGVRGIAVAGIFNPIRKYMRKGDVSINEESLLRRLINSGNYRAIIADPMIKQLINSENMSKIKFYSLPHVAISSKVHWDEYRRLLSTETEEWLSNIK